MNTKNHPSIRILSSAAAAALTLLPASAMAYGPQAQAGTTDRFVYYWDYLTAGTTYTYETSNMTGTSPDTMLHVLSNVSGPFQEYAMNDDCAGSLRSCVTFTPPVSGYYGVWIHGYGTYAAGKTDLYRNGALVLSQADFGGRRIYDTWSSGDTFQAPGSQNKAPVDSMVFLLRDTGAYAQHDDDSGPNLYPYLVATSQEGGWASSVVGSYPGTPVSHTIYLHDHPINAQTDADGDGISNDMEDRLGGNRLATDSDADTIPDNLELLGNDGWSFSEWGRYFARDAYVEVDYMTHPTDATKTRQTYAGLAADVAEIFATGTTGLVNVTVFIDNPVDWHEVTCFGSCAPSVVDGVNFYDVKTGNFSTWNPERKPYFHYALWAYRHSGNANGSSGLAEILGNDLIVSLGAWSHTTGQQRGTFVHELGHNLNLGHFGNGNNSGANSAIHQSVMNYRYQIAGVPGTGRHTYSAGPSNECESCATSPKQACVDCRNAGACGSPSCAACDCDLDEWSSLSLDFRSGVQTDGADAVIGARSAEPDEKVHPPAAPDVDALLAEPPHARAARVRQRAAALEARGEQRGRDFAVSADGLHVHSVCQ